MRWREETAGTNSDRAVAVGGKMGKVGGLQNEMAVEREAFYTGFSGR